MSDWFKDWTSCLELLLGDDLISYYAFFTTILAEIAYLWAFKSNVAGMFTIILLGFIANVIVTAFVKGYLIRTRKSNIVSSIAYILIYLGLFAWGAYYAGLKTSAILTAIPFAVSFLFVNIRFFQITIFPTDMKIQCKLSKFFGKEPGALVSQICIIGIPLFVFAIFFSKIPNIPTFLKIIVPIIYAFIAPYIAYMEDDIATDNIFELAFEWDYF